MNKHKFHWYAPSSSSVPGQLDRVALEDKVRGCPTPTRVFPGSREKTATVKRPDMILGIVVVAGDLLEENTRGMARAQGTAMSVMATEELCSIRYRQCVATTVKDHWEVEAPANAETMAATTRNKAKYIAMKVTDFDIFPLGRRRSLRWTVAFGSRAARGGIRRKATSETFAIRLTPEIRDLGRE